MPVRVAAHFGRSATNARPPFWRGLRRPRRWRKRQALRRRLAAPPPTHATGSALPFASSIGAARHAVLPRTCRDALPTRRTEPLRPL
eukprot:7381602-Prymnesium_polylepis.1